MGDRSVETLGSKSRFWSFLETFPTPTMLIFLFFRQHRPQHLENIEYRAGGIRELTLNGNKIEQVLQYRKLSFSQSVSTTLLAHCSSSPILWKHIYSITHILQTKLKTKRCHDCESTAVQMSMPWPRIYTIVQLSNDIPKRPKDTVSTSEPSIRIKSEPKLIYELIYAKNVRLQV